MLVCVLCAASFIGYSSEADPESWQALNRWGYVGNDDIWGGAWWAYVTSVFFHASVAHLAFNAWWLWELGGALEVNVGRIRWLAFFAASAIVSSGVEFLYSADTGVGASGVVYALFGFLWVGRRRYPSFRDHTTRREVSWMVGWALFCVVATATDMWEVGNAAHVSGLIFGMAVAAVVTRRHQLLGMCAAITCAAAAVLPLFWMPWSVEWLSHRAYAAHDHARLDEAIEWYGKIIARDAKNAWAYYNRALAWEGKGETERASADFDVAKRLDPSYGK